MEQIIIQLSKYLIIVFITIYTFQCFSVFRYAGELERQGIYFRQIFLMILINFFGFLSIYCAYGELKYFKAYLIEQIGILFLIFIYKIIYPTANRLIINNMCMLLTIGFIILTRLSYAKAMRQFVIAMGAVVITLVVPFLITRITFFEKFKWIYIGVGFSSLLIVLLFSSVTNGSKLSLSVANTSFQPSEYVKIIFVFGIASILATGKELKDILISAVVAGAHVLILVASKDLGSAVIFFVVYICMLFVATRNYIYFFSGLLGAAICSVVAYKLFSHVRVRVLAYTDPFGHINDAGYQICQSLFAIGTGGWLGMGITQGAPKTIPVVAQDFVFAAICEEFGVIFGMCLIMICVSCFIMFMNIAMRFHDRFFRLVALGLAVAYGFQVLLTIGGVTKFIPMTGVTLPLVSYGGTSVAVTCCVFSVIQGLYIYRGREFAHAKEALQARKESHIIKDNSVSAGIPRRKPVHRGFGNSSMDTQMMDEAFEKAVNEGINISDGPDLDEVIIQDWDEV